ncbi:MAG: helix-turn-helix domain-containing protein [Micrococcus sp.]|nr:helix-turn-helix domain-containing protein [Micrococcus sp.]
MYLRAPIRERHAAGEPIRAIAREMGISRNTVRRAIDPTRPARYVRRSQLDEVTDQIREVLARWPHMPAVGIAHRIGWRGSMSTFTQRVNVLRRERLYGAPGASA